MFTEVNYYTTRDGIKEYEIITKDIRYIVTEEELLKLWHMINTALDSG